MTYTLTTLEVLLKHSPKSDHPEGAPVFRGQSRPFPLVPSLFRAGHACRPHGTWQSYEQTLVRLFYREAKRHVLQVPPNLTDQIVLAQHFGLPTRLLDWTRSPLVALYFAVEDLDPKYNGVIWTFTPTREFFRPPETWNELRSLSEIHLYSPPRAFDRVAVQHGCLSIHPLPKGFKRFIPLEETANSSAMTRFDVPGHMKFDYMKMLDDFGVIHHTIYPDLDGVAKSVRWKMTRLRKSAKLSTKHTVHQKLI